MKILILAAVLVASPALADPPPSPLPQPVADGIWLIPGSFPQGRQPDGNTVVFQGKSGLIVMDTGRHTWHRQAIIDFAHTQNLPVTALINSHWHLDHTSGNRDLKALWPEAKLYTGTAVIAWGRDHFAKGIASSQAYLDTGQAPPDLAEDIRGDIVTRQHPEALLPDVPVTDSQMRDIDGRPLDIRLAPHAATDGDVWVYDPQSHVVAAGDLITLPVPFLDTACVDGWKAGLDAISATDFTLVIPGHGAPMTRAQFEGYRTAFGAYVDCAHGNRAATDCAADWLKASAERRAPEAPDDARATEMAGEYVDLLRQNGGDSAFCTTG